MSTSAEQTGTGARAPSLDEKVNYIDNMQHNSIITSK